MLQQNLPLRFLLRCGERLLQLFDPPLQLLDALFELLDLRTGGGWRGRRRTLSAGPAGS